MKKIQRFCTILFIISCVLCVEGPCYADPCGISLEFDFLMTKPFLENTNFVCSNRQGALGPSPVGYDTQNVPGYRPHYRGEIAYAFNNCDQLALIGSYYKTSSVAKARAPAQLTPAPLIPTQGIPAYLNLSAGSLFDATSVVDLQFYNIELLYQTKVCCSNRFLLNLIGGIQFADFKYEEDITYNLLSGAGFLGNNFRNLSHFAGVGPEAGVDFDVFLWRCKSGCIAFHGSFTGSVLASYTKARHQGGYGRTVTAPPLFNPDLKRNNWTFNPVWFAGAGINYTLSCWCWMPTIEIGVKCANYYHAITKFFFVAYDAFGTISTAFVNKDEYSNVGFFSPYVSLKVTF